MRRSGARYARDAAVEVRRDTVESAAARVLAEPGLYLLLAPFEAGSRTMLDAANYLIQNGYHRIYADDAITETTEFAARAAVRRIAGARAPMMVVVDRVAVNGEAEVERVSEALEKAFYLGGGRARCVRVERENGRTHTAATLDFDRRFNCSNCATVSGADHGAVFVEQSDRRVSRMRRLRAHGRTRSRQGDSESQPVASAGTGRDLADAGVSRDERLDDQAGAAPENSNLGAISRDDRRGARVAARRRPGSARKEVGRRRVAGRARVFQVA